jgi:hypothetical protein
MLGASKHVDTILEAWRKDGPADAKLLLVGQSDRDTADLISAATESDASGIVWVNERTSDTEFDNYIESADYVFTTYRYSSSSGVALRALALGSRVVYGGSSALIRDLEGVTGTYRISPVTAETVGEFFRNTPEMSTPEFQDGSPENLVFPTPIVEAIRKAISAT